MKTATRTVSGANTADAPPVGPENRTAGENRFRMVGHETLSVRRREVSPLTPAFSGSVLVALEELRCQVRQQPHRKPDDVRNAPLQPFDQARTQRLYCVAARTPLPLPEPHVTVLFLLGQILEDPRRLLPPPPLLAINDHHQATHDGVSPSRHPVEVSPSLRSISGLPQHLAL